MTNSISGTLKPKIKEVQAKEIVIKSNLPAAPFVCNPYTGCQAGCAYCYASFIKKWTGHLEDDWGEFVDIKINAPELADKKKHAGKDILFSSVTDPYQPLEGRYRLTRQVLEKLVVLEPQPTIGILTKSYLVTRDIDLLTRFNTCTVGFSFSTLDDSVRKIIEPITPIVKTRIAAVEKIHTAGIRTYVFVSPILPYLTEVDQIVRTLRPYVDFFMFENLNIRSYLWSRLKSSLEKLDPTLIPRYESIYSSKEEYCRYWDAVETEIKNMAERDGFQAKLFFHHSK